MHPLILQTFTVYYPAFAALCSTPKRSQEKLHRGLLMGYSSHVKFYLHFLQPLFERTAVNIL